MRHHGQEAVGGDHSSGPSTAQLLSFTTQGVNRPGPKYAIFYQSVIHLTSEIALVQV
jgi:hypothetical protein